MTEDHANGPPPERRIFCNRTLNLRSIQAIGYDMDYTLVHYQRGGVGAAGVRAAPRRCSRRGWPVAGLDFDPHLVMRGLVIDTELGNIVKANRFGFVTRAAHGTRVLDFEEHRARPIRARSGRL